MTMENFNFEKTFALILGAFLGIILMSQIVGCGGEIQPVPKDWAAWNDSTTAAFLDSLEQDSLSMTMRVDIEMEMKKKFAK